MFKWIKRVILNLYAKGLVEENERLQSIIDSNTPVEVKVEVVTRLNRDVYDKFRKTLPNLVVTDTTSPTHAATKLGIAQVLEKLEKELVI